MVKATGGGNDWSANLNIQGHIRLQNDYTEWSHHGFFFILFNETRLSKSPQLASEQMQLLP